MPETPRTIGQVPPVPPGRGVRRPFLPALCLSVVAFSGALIVADTPAYASDNVWVVNTTSDDGAPCTSASCSLRSALNAANSSAGSDTINFAIPATTTPVITVLSALPAITGSSVSVDATTQSGGRVPGVVLTPDPSITATVNGLQLTGGNVTVRGFAITNFTGDGISVTSGSTGDVIAANWIGTSDGVTAAGNTGDGIHLAGGGNHVIGGSRTDGNVIVGSRTGNGIEMTSSNSNVVAGNIVGMSANGANRLPNAGVGIGIHRTSSQNQIGGLTADGRNIVTGNSGIGVQLLGTLLSDGTCEGPTYNVVEGNYIGLTAAGTKPSPYGNLGEGVEIEECASNNLIGGTDPGARNVVSGNHDDGIEFDNFGSPAGLICNNTIQGNYVGTDPSGTKNIPNVDAGVKVQNGACNTLVGGAAPGAANLISGNDSDGVYLKSNPAGTQVIGNIIGLAADGSTPLPNGGNGVRLFSGARSELIESNTISANSLSGVYLQDARTNSNTIRGNRIGTTVDGSAARGNQRYGVHLTDGPTGNVVEKNTIQGNALAGVAVETVAGSGNSTVNNKVTGNAMSGNGGLGVDLLPAPGVNLQSGSHLDPVIGNDGLDYPVITTATTTSAEGTSIPGTVVELFSAAGATGENNGEGAVYLGSATADGSGAWCLDGLSVSGSTMVTATATTSAGDTSEFAVDVMPSGSGDVCTAPPPSATTIFGDTFSGADGSILTNWDVRRSATGAGSGARIQSNQLAETDALAADQNGSWQYVQARETVVQPSWSAGTLSVRWQMATSATSTQTSSLVLTPSATTGNATSQSDYLRIYVTNGKLFLVAKRAGAATTLWSGTEAVSSTVRDFELRIDAVSVTLLEGPTGTAAVRAGPIPHGLAFASGYAYLQASTNSVTTYVALFDTFAMVKSPGPPAAPTAVTATAGEGSAQVSWTAPGSDGGVPITSYTVTSSGGQQVVAAAGASGVVPTSATIGGLTAGTSYTFTVKATNDVGTGPASALSNAVIPDAVRTPPDAPTSVTARAGDAQATISWRPPAFDGNSPITGYTVTASDGQRLAVLAGPDGTVPTASSIQGLENGTSYTFTVSTTNGVGTGPDSTPSNTVTPIPNESPPGAPTGVTATAGNASAAVSWTAPSTDGGSPITSYTVTSSAGDRTTVPTHPDGSVPTNTTMTGLTNGNSYTFVVTATNALGPGDDSAPSNSVIPQAVQTVPGAPTGVTAQAGDSSAQVSWTAPVDDGNSAIVSYTVRSSAGNQVTVTGANGTVPTGTTVTGLTNGTSYTFTVHATNAVGAGPESTPSSPVVPGPQVLFSDDFTGADGTTPANWEIRRSAAGTGSGATIGANTLLETDTLSSAQVGTWQYVQAREKVVQASWDSGTASVAWQMSTAASASQTSSLILTPTAVTTNATGQADYLRVYVSNGKLFVVRNKAGTLTTLWSGTVTASTGLRAFRLDLNATNLALSEGPPGSLVTRVGSLPHGLGFTGGYPYLQVSTNAAATYTGNFDGFVLTKGSS